LQPDSAAAFYTVRRPVVQTATGQDDDAALPDVGKNHDLCEHSSGDHDKTLDAAASCKELILAIIDSSCAGLTRASILKNPSIFRTMDCRVKPGNDDEESLDA
jgi:hypothetical protein